MSCKNRSFTLQMPNIRDTLLNLHAFATQLLSRRWRPHWNDTILRHNVAVKSAFSTSAAAHMVQALWCIFKWKVLLCDRQSVEASNAGSTVVLDAVYKQATAAAPLLHSKAAALSARSWSASCQIRVLPVLISGAGTRHVEDREAVRNVDKGPVSEQACSLMGVKPWERAVEKLVRCYAGDPARLVDCCRQARGCMLNC